MDKDKVSLALYKQVAWERDMAISQLNELGYAFGESIPNNPRDNRVRLNFAEKLLQNDVVDRTTVRKVLVQLNGKESVDSYMKTAKYHFDKGYEQGWIDSSDCFFN